MKLAYAIFPVLLATAFGAQAAEKVTVFAAASLKDVMEAAETAFEAQADADIVVSLAASSALAKQIEQGAPAHVFISADQKWMDYISERGLTDTATQMIVARNSLVVAVAANSARTGDIATILGSEKFSMGDPAGVPAGKYAQAALEKLGLWQTVKANAVFAENVRAALAFVDKGELPAAIVYGSDVFVDGKVKTAATFDPLTHPEIIYPAAVLKDSSDTAKAFVAFLSGEAGQRIIVEKGFKPAKPSPSQ
jgi:molybdate transport system substrate-binding protein